MEPLIEILYLDLLNLNIDILPLDVDYLKELVDAV